MYTYLFSAFFSVLSLPRARMRSKGLSNRFVRQTPSVVVVVVVVVNTKTAGSGVLGTWVSCNGDQTIKNCKKLAWVGLKWNDTGHESYKWLVLCCYIGHAYRPHPAIPRVDSAAHALTQ